MKTTLIIILLFIGLTLNSQNSTPVEPFSQYWPTEQQNSAQLRSTSSNPFDDIDDNPDPDPVPIGDSLGLLFLFSVGYAFLRNKKKSNSSETQK